MRFADAVLRRGHLSERALVEVGTTGERPAHLDRCEICAAQADALATWLDQVRVDGIDAADDEFPRERLAAQHSQILDRLEQLDHPAKVLAFPAAASVEPQVVVTGLKPFWVAAAVAASLVAGIITGRVTTHLNPAPPVTVAAAAANHATSPKVAPSSNLNEDILNDTSLERVMPESLRAMDTLTPHASEVVFIKK